MRRLAFALCLVAAPAAAEDCARYDDPLAFNACLARQGPGAKAVSVGKAPARRAQAPVVTRRGRSEMVFSVGK